MRPRDIGTRTETAVVRYLVATGWPSAERRSLKGAYDQGDVTGTPGLCWEIKGGQAACAASDGQILIWLAETELERINARCEHGVLVVQRRGIGERNADRWWAVLTAQTYHDLTAMSVHPGVPVPADERIIVPVMPVRIWLRHAVRLLRRAGYGNPMPEGEL